MAGRIGSYDRENWLSGRENWLSPVIQATWEARTVGWLEKEGSLYALIESHLWPPYGQPAWKGQIEEVTLSQMSGVFPR